MTIFGKLIMGVLLLIIGSGIYYGLTSYVKNDGETVVNTEIVQNTNTVTDEASTTIMNGTSTTLSATSTATSTKQGKKIPFTDFIGKGGSYTCEVTQSMASMNSKGTFYMHDNLVRVEFATTLAGQSMNTTMIARDGYTYSWTSLSPTKGFKTKIPQGDVQPGTSPTYTWNGSQVGDYSCEVWKADDTLFVLPKDIVFADTQ